MGEELTLTLTIEWEREDDGRWIADIPELPGVMAYGASLPEAVAKVSGLGATRAIELLAEGKKLDGVTFKLTPEVAA